MCVIVDTNCAADIFTEPVKSDYAPLLDWLFNPRKNGAIVFGGKHGEELFKMGNVSRRIRVLMQAGRAFPIKDDTIKDIEQEISKLGFCVSDDLHVIALAQASGARTLCSHDQDLHDDFKNKKLIDKPRGNIYQNATHSNLLIHTSGCKKPK